MNTALLVQILRASRARSNDETGLLALGFTRETMAAAVASGLVRKSAATFGNGRTVITTYTA